MRPYRRPTKTRRAAQCLRVNHADAPSLPAACLPHGSRSSHHPATLFSPLPFWNGRIQSHGSSAQELSALIGTYRHTLYSPPVVSDCLRTYAHCIDRHECVLSRRKFSTQAHSCFMDWCTQIPIYFLYWCIRMWLRTWTYTYTSSPVLWTWC